MKIDDLKKILDSFPKQREIHSLSIFDSCCEKKLDFEISLVEKKIPRKPPKKKIVKGTK